MKTTAKIGLGLIAGIMAASSAFAQGGQEGHGGNAVACFKNGMAQVIAKRARLYQKQGKYQDPIGDDGIAALSGRPQLLDLFEIRMTSNLDGVRPELISPPSTVSAGLKEALKRAQDTNDVFYTAFLKYAQKRIPYLKFSLTDTAVVEVDDSNTSILLPAHCLLLQIAVQTKNGEDENVIIDRRLFSRMSVLDQTALVTHEWFVNSTMTHGNDRDSNRARKMNAILYRKDFAPHLARSSLIRLLPLMKLNRRFAFMCSTEDDCAFDDYRSNFDRAFPLSLNTYGEGLMQRTAGYTGFLLANGLRKIEYPEEKEYRGYRIGASLISNGNLVGVYVYDADVTTPRFPKFFTKKERKEILVRFNDDGTEDFCGKDDSGYYGINFPNFRVEHSEDNYKDYRFERCYTNRDSFASFELFSFKSDPGENIARNPHLTVIKNDGRKEDCRKVRITNDQYECVK